MAVSWPSRPVEAAATRLGDVVVPDHDAGRAEHLVGDAARASVGLDHLRGGRLLAAIGALGDDPDAGGVAERGGAAGRRLGDARR